MDYPRYIDDDDVRLWLKEMVLAGREVSCTWRPGKHAHFNLESADDAQAAEQLDYDAIIQIWAEGWLDKDGEDCWDAKYIYDEVDGKLGWWRT